MTEAENIISRLANASVYAGDLYVTAHPNSEMGDPNYADSIGYEFVCYTPIGLMIYRRKGMSGIMIHQDYLLGGAVILALTILVILYGSDTINNSRMGWCLMAVLATALFDYLARFFRRS